ncbi:hypothetical protein [Cerasicoccus arenae]|uniref:Uncharacterized protein n=1 Tax=Cerasicoccus arenae TaxID=424488 RepID=A0A8J3DDR1_9BACT|nr:hypothetical protein [Cerasicoccus arenae]MBK1857838.1 hypothetical protein [Cerasicoccus arenae]GHC11570.1 hypothetical protein GCM10007047_31050 [Cerasicoccus arenae]
MEAENRKLVTPVGALIDVCICGGVFLFFFFVVIPSHVPFYDPFWKNLFTAYTSAVMSGFAWLALCLFRVTRVDYCRAKKEAKSA